MTLSTEIRAAFVRNLSCKTLAFCHNKLCMCVPVDSCRTKIITNAVFVLKEKGFSFAHIVLYQFLLYWHTSPATKSFSAQSERLHQFTFIPKISIFAFVCIFVFAHAPRDTEPCIEDFAPIAKQITLFARTYRLY